MRLIYSLCLHTEHDAYEWSFKSVDVAVDKKSLCFQVSALKGKIEVDIRDKFIWKKNQW